MRLKAYPEFQRQFCPFCRENRKLPYCKEEVRCADCPWKGKEPEIPYPGDLTMKVCACCGKKLPYGDAFSSRELYNGSGMFGMAICPKCHEAEWKREKKRRKNR